MDTKPGYKTTEFWMAAIASVLTILNQSGAIGHAIPTDAVLSIAGLVAAYVASRAVVKK
jgi:hypothetical protein